MSGKVQSGRGPGRFGFEHAVAGFLGSAAFGNDEAQRLAQGGAELVQYPVHAVGVSVVEEKHSQPIGPGLAEGMGHELRAQCRAADADDEQVFEGAERAPDFAVVHFLRERLHCGHGAVDLFTNGGGGRQGGVAQPVMSDHAFLVGVGKGALLQFPHRGERLLHPGFHPGEKVIRKIHPAHVNREANGGVLGIGMLLQTGPELFFGKRHSQGRSTA